MEEDLEALEWDVILQCIESGESALFIGPCATVNYGDPERERIWMEALAQTPRYKSRIRGYHLQDHLLLLDGSDGFARQSIGGALKAYYNDIPTNDALRTLAQVPFRVFVTLSPDHAIEKVFEEADWKHESAFFGQSPPGIGSKPSAERPLIYHLAGDTRSERTMVVTHEDLFLLNTSLQGGLALPAELSNEISAGPESRRKLHIFIGFDLDRWQTHLLLSVLGVKKSVRHLVVLPSMPAPQQIDLHRSQYDVQFVKAEPAAFAERLLKEVPQAKRRQVLSDRERRFASALSECLNAAEFTALAADHYPKVSGEYLGGERSRMITAILQQVKAQDAWPQLAGQIRAINDQCIHLKPEDHDPA